MDSIKYAILMLALIVLYSITSVQGASEEGIAPIIYTENQNNNLPSDHSISKNPNTMSVNANFPDDYGVITVKKSANPSYKDFYLLNKTYSVKVEIIGIGRAIDNITIKEKVDPNLKIAISPPYPRILDPFSDSSIEYMGEINTSESNTTKRSKYNYSANYNDNSINLRINKLMPKHCIQYNFNITSDEIGVFDATTMVRIAGDHSKHSDLYIPFDIEVRPPVFEVHVNKESSQAVVKKPLNITYNIIHKSGWCTDPFELNVSFSDSSNSEYSIFRNGHIYQSGEKIRTSFSNLKYTPINISIYYKNSGVQSLPEILVEGQVVPIPYEEAELRVYEEGINKLMEEYEPTLSTYGLIVALIISTFSLFFSFRDIGIARKQILILNDQLDIMKEELKIIIKNADIRYPERTRNNVEGNLVQSDYIDADEVPISHLRIVSKP